MAKKDSASSPRRLRRLRRLKKAHHGVAVLEFFGFPPGFRHIECIAFAVAEDEQAVSRQQRRKMRVVEQLLGERCGAASDILFAVRRVGEDQIELLVGGRQLLQRGEGILNPDLQPGGIQPHLLEVVPQNLGVTIGHFDTDGRHRGAAQTFQTQRPGSGE